MQQKISCLPNKRIKYHEWYKRAVLPALHVLNCVNVEQKGDLNMSNGRNDSSDLAVMVLGAIAIIIGGVTYCLINIFNVPWEVGLKSAFPVFIWGCGFIALIFGCFRYEALINALPFYISMTVPALSPILKYIAGDREGYPFQMEVSWFGTGWGMFLIFALINAIGYGFIYWLHRRNSYYW